MEKQTPCERRGVCKCQAVRLTKLVNFSEPKITRLTGRRRKMCNEKHSSLFCFGGGELGEEVSGVKWGVNVPPSL